MREHWEALQERIDRARTGAGRTDSVRLLGACKKQPAAQLIGAYDLGLRDFAESTAQGLVRAQRALAAHTVRWHFIGQLQGNKGALVSSRVQCLHSLDRTRLVARLVGPLEVLVQVNFGDDPQRGGALPADVPALVDAVAAASTLRLVGFMTVPPAALPPRPFFSKLRALRDRYCPSPGELSRGMSGDLEDAIAEGATMVRIGTDLFGRR
jgi:pyridoxal phosphate enzyme (YggS family)